MATGTAPLVVASASQVANLNASLLGGLPSSAFQPAGAYATLGSNSFTGSQSINGSLTIAGSINGGLLVSSAGSNSVANFGSFVGGGFSNKATGASIGYATIGGGAGNNVSYDLGTIGGGSSNTASGTANGYATVAGGGYNSALDDYASVGPPPASNVFGRHRNGAQNSNGNRLPPAKARPMIPFAFHPPENPTWNVRA